MALGASGNAYVGGVTASDFPTTAGAFRTTYGGRQTDTLVSKSSFGIGPPTMTR